VGGANFTIILNACMALGGDRFLFLKTKDLYIGGGKTKTEISLEFNALLFPMHLSWPPDCWVLLP
jgi:hypothetical protein